MGDQESPYVPVRVINNSNKINLLNGIYGEDTWQITETLRANFGLRWDRLSGYSDKSQFDPSVNLVYLPHSDTTLHAGFARYMQVPSFQGISPGAPTAFVGTSGYAGTGTVNPETEDDYEWIRSAYTVRFAWQLTSLRATKMALHVTLLVKPRCIVDAIRFAARPRTQKRRPNAWIDALRSIIS